MTDHVPARPLMPAAPDPALGLPEFNPTEPPTPAERAIGRGLRYLHVRDATQREEAWLTTLNARALLDLLVAKGVITQSEFFEQRRAVEPEIRQAFQADPSAPFLESTADKYQVVSPDIDCAARFPLCRARCCTLALALSAQDLDEGVVRWDYSRPYAIARRADGYCAHCQPDTGACGVYQHRPATCRGYDCRNDRRIWIDFEARLPADYAAQDAQAEADRAARAATEALIRRATEG